MSGKEGFLAFTRLAGGGGVYERRLMCISLKRSQGKECLKHPRRWFSKPLWAPPSALNCPPPLGPDAPENTLIFFSRAPRCGSGPIYPLEGSPIPPLQLEDLSLKPQPFPPHPPLPPLPLPPHRFALFRCCGKGRPRQVWGRGPRVRGGGGLSKRHLGPAPHLSIFEISSYRYGKSSKTTITGAWKAPVIGTSASNSLGEGLVSKELFL